MTLTSDSSTRKDASSIDGGIHRSCHSVNRRFRRVDCSDRLVPAELKKPDPGRICARPDLSWVGLLAGQAACKGFRWIQVTARNRTDGIRHGKDRQAKGERNAKKTDAEAWECTGDHRTPHPVNTSQKVPMNSAALRLPRVMTTS